MSVTDRMDRGAAMTLAHDWARRGVPGIPLKITWDDEKHKTDKVPLTEHGFLDASTDERTLRGMFNKAQWSGAWGVGLRLGPAGYLAVDVDGPGDLELWEDRGLPPTYAPTTASGSRHFWYRKLDAERVGTTCEWAEVDVIRADDGFVVAPGTVSPWGNWETFDEYPADVVDCPPELWAVIERGGSSAGSSGVDERGLDVVLAKLTADRRDQDAEALTVLVRQHGGHHPFITRDGKVYVTRPDKAAGKSASVGYVAPGVVKMFSTGWPGLADQHRYIVGPDRAVLIDADELVIGSTSRNGDHPSDATKGTTGQRRVGLTPASTIKPRPVRWLWHNRVALGTLALLGGREGVGKSMAAYQLTADITRGQLAGIYHGTPRAVLVCATEDSWAHTIVPRLMAAGADLERVYRIDVTTAEGVTGTLTLPTDLGALEAAVAEVDAAAIVLDPLLSRLSTALDSHKDAEVRVALEPLVALADRVSAAVVGLIHVNKATTVDPLTMLMASRAFAAVSRAVLFVAVDPEDETGRRRYLGQPKNNLGTLDLPLLAFTIEPTLVATTDEGEVWTGRVEWRGEDDRSIAEVLRTAAEPASERTDADECADWLGDYLTINTIARSDEIKAAAREYGHKEHTLKRARREIGAGATGYGFPRHTWWSRPGMTPDEIKAWLDDQGRQADDSGHAEAAQSGLFPLETHQLVLTVPTEVLTPRSDTVGTVGTSLRVSRSDVTTANGDQRPCPLCPGTLDERGLCSEPDCAGF